MTMRDFAVILPKPLGCGRKSHHHDHIRRKRRGEQRGRRELLSGGARELVSERAGRSLREYALYDMTLRIPKGMKMAATGDACLRKQRGRPQCDRMEERSPQTVAGFSFGKFKEEEVKLDQARIFHPVLCQRRVSRLGDDLKNGSREDLSQRHQSVHMIGGRAGRDEHDDA